MAAVSRLVPQEVAPTVDPPVASCGGTVVPVSTKRTEPPMVPSRRLSHSRHVLLMDFKDWGKAPSLLLGIEQH